MTELRLTLLLGPRETSVYHRLAAAHLIASLRAAAFLDGLVIGGGALLTLALLWWLI